MLYAYKRKWLSFAVKVELIWEIIGRRRKKNCKEEKFLKSLGKMSRGQQQRQQQQQMNKLWGLEEEEEGEKRELRQRKEFLPPTHRVGVVTSKGR